MRSQTTFQSKIVAQKGKGVQIWCKKCMTFLFTVDYFGKVIVVDLMLCLCVVFYFCKVFVVVLIDAVF